MHISALANIGAAAASLDRAIALIPGSVRSGLEAVAKVAAANAKASQAFKDHSGYLRKNIKGFVFTGGPYESHVMADSFYADWVEYGRGPVRPIHAKMLRWFVNGRPVFSMYSKPSKPRLFMTRGAKMAEIDSYYQINGHVTKAIRQAG